MTDLLPALSCSLIRVLSPPLTQHLHEVLEAEPAGRRERLPGEELHSSSQQLEELKYRNTGFIQQNLDGLSPRKKMGISASRPNWAQTGRDQE